VIGHYRDPQKAHPWPKPHLHANFGADRSAGATWARAEGIKTERKKARKETFAGAVFPLTLVSGLYNSLYYRTSCDTYTDKTDLIICPMLWYSNGTDN